MSGLSLRMRIVLQGDPDPDYNTKKNDMEGHREKTSSSRASETRIGGDYAADIRLVFVLGQIRTEVLTYIVFL